MATIGTLRIEAITPAVGAIVHGVDLRQEPDPQAIAQIRRAVLDQGVVFLREQDVTREQVARFMRCFGPLGTDPFSVAALAPPTPEHSVHDMPPSCRCAH
jgi:taurine dioxygenase